MLLFFIATLTFSCFYLLSGYDALVKWFVGLNNCFYRQETWGSMFFTPQIKSSGNKYCVAAILVATAGIFYSVKHIRSRNNGVHRRVIFIENYDLSLGAICFVAATLLWFWGNSLVHASNDEVFSAMNCAGIHPFQMMAYYMLPNNHILFNLLNNIFFHPLADKVVTGRVLSLICYWVLILTLFAWWKRLFKNRWLAIVAALTMALQFPVWGFCAQARGYELLTLTAWISFIALYNYLFSHRKEWLYVLAVSSVAGYFTIPIFLYFHSAVIVFAFFYQLFHKKADLVFWKYQVATGFMVFLLYLPTLCFSGQASITGNAWVNTGLSYKELLGSAFSSFTEYMDFCFCNPVTGHYVGDLVLFLTPVCLLFYRRNKLAFSLGGFYVVLWVVCALITLKMRVYPIDRALTAQFSITLALVIYTVYSGASSLARKMNKPVLSIVVVSLFLTLLNVNYIIKGRLQIVHYLCHFPVNGWYDFINEGMKVIPANSTVGYSTESFYWYYALRKNNYIVSKCNTGNEVYYIKTIYEQMPPERVNNYADFKRVGDFNIYKRK